MVNANSGGDADSEGTLRDILADLTVTENSESGTPLNNPSLWSFANAPRHSSSTSSRPSPLPRTSSLSRPAPQQRSLSGGQVPSLPNGEPSCSQSPLFNTPSRSIFSSGPATASVSVNTAQASMSPALPSTISRPLSVLTTPSASQSRKNSGREPQRDAPSLNLNLPSTSVRRHRLQVPEKDVDDPSTLPADDTGPDTSTALSKLFASNSSTIQSMSRPVSYLNSTSGPMSRPNEGSLTTHLLHRGLMDGRHSDITVHAFGTSYKLHRLLLDRVPFFSSALSGPWTESHSKEMALHPEEIDSNITRNAFELALKRIYGCNLPIEEEQEALNLFATGCWLDMLDLVDASVDALLRQMHPSKLDRLISLVTGNYYGKAGDRILASAKAVLCREGWEMPYDYWDGIPADIIREVIGGDAFFIPSEWERWYLTVRLLNRRLKSKAIEHGLVAPDGRLLQPRPTSLKFFAIRFDTVYRRDSMLAQRHVSEKDDAWVALYTSPDVAPLLVLMDEGVHYVHLRFEQLQQIRSQKDILGVPVLPEKIISNALWMSMELRQRVVNAQEADQELGFSQLADELTEEEEQSTTPQTFPTTQKGKEPQHEQQPHEMESDSWDLNGRPRKFWIPITDSSSIMGGTAEAFTAATLSNIASWTPHMTRLSASLEPSDVQWATDFMANGIEAGAGHSRNSSADQPQQPRYSHYPPFRFSAEFPNPRTLKERKRIYSDTVWYAGSMWNLYIQRQNTSKNQQLGIYLHRAKERDHQDDHQGPPLSQLTVDARIGQLEREMLMRKGERRSRHWQSAVTSSGGEADPEDETTSGSGGDPDGSLFPNDVPSTERSRLRRSADLIDLHKTSQSSTTTVRPETRSSTYLMDSDEENDELARASRKFSVPTMPPYIDARPTIRTYFKIYSPSKAGRMLSVYESAPDRFNFSQSWGWKSSQMVLDDGIAGYDVMKGGKDGKLRYMVVIGNV